MSTVGIIVEYNPLHNGHVYHFQQSKMLSGADTVVAVMSGHFLQRGEPAAVNKWARAEMALRMGADLVLELPVAYSSQPAEWFAFGAVSALEATGVVDALCFGSESGDLGELKAMASVLHEMDQRHDGKPEEKDEQPFSDSVRAQLKTGTSYPAAYAAAASRLVDGDAAEWLAQPNNSLGLHYLIALERLNSRIVPYTVRRWKSGYNQTDITDERIASATAIRKLLSSADQAGQAESYVPPYTMDILRREMAAGRAPVRWNCLFRPLFARLAVLPPEQLAEFAEVTEGLEHRIKRVLPSIDPAAGDPFEQLVGALKTKRYTRTKLQRMLLRILLNHKKDTLSAAKLRQGVPYLRVLGFSERGRGLLKTMRKTARVPVISKTASFRHPFLELDIEATAVHALAYREPTARDIYRDYYEPPIRLDKGAN